MIPGVWLSAGSHRGGTAAAQLPTREPGLAASQRGELERDAQGWMGTGRGWLISVTPSSQARLGGRAWSCPGAGAEKLPSTPRMGLLSSPTAQCHAPAAAPRQMEPGLGLPWLLALMDTESPGCESSPHSTTPQERGPCPAASPAAPGLCPRSAVTSAGRCRQQSRRGPAAGSGSSATGTP